MVLSMFNQMEFPFECPKCKRGKRIVISRLDKITQWSCECGQHTNLTKEPYASEIKKLRRVASEHDKQERQAGKTVERHDD
jgi:hypothetical protein